MTKETLERLLIMAMREIAMLEAELEVEKKLTNDLMGKDKGLGK